MRQILDVLPGALLPDPIAESESPGAPLSPPDDDDLLRPAIEEELFRVGESGSLIGSSTTALAKHLVWTFGPVHRGLPFPLALRVELDGDRLVTVDPEIGFLHQGLEKAGELLAWPQCFALMARVHPLAPLGHELAWALVVERLCALDTHVPRRAQLWRTIALELLRIAEHLQVLSQSSLSPASDTLRRNIVDAARIARGLVDGLALGGALRAAGGLAKPIHDDEAARIAKELPRVVAVAQEVRHELDTRPALDAHLEGLGRISRQRAIGLGITGPALRACGVLDDLRVHEPVFAWEELAVTPSFAEHGDARARGRVRWAEILTSADVVTRALAKLTAAPPEWAVPVPATLPIGTASASLEMPNGELTITAVSDGSARPARVRIRGPSSALVAALPAILVGDRIDDVIPVLSGLGLIGTELDR